MQAEDCERPARCSLRANGDGCGRRASLELLLGVECEACLALAARGPCGRPVAARRARTLSAHDMRRMARSADRSDYVPKQVVATEQTSSLVQKMKQKLSALSAARAGARSGGRGCACSSASLRSRAFADAVNTSADFSDVAQCFDLLRDRSGDPWNAKKAPHSALGSRSRCGAVRRQMSTDDFASARPPHAAHASGDPRVARCTCAGHDHDHAKEKAGAADATGRPHACEAAPRTPPPSHSSTATANSRLAGWQRRWCCAAALLLVAGSACVAGPLALRAPPGAPLPERLRLAQQLLHDSPLVDGHNDLPWNIRKFLHNRIKDFRFDEDLRTISPWATSSWSHTDLPRLKLGRVAAQFWAAYVPCESQHKDAVQLTFEQIDLIRRLTEKYHPELTFCTSANDISRAHTSQRVCSLVGVEGGHAIGGSLGVLRSLYRVGVRYLTLTSSCDTPWAECASSQRLEPSPGGLSPFGKVVIREMNRLGMLVDLSHVSERTMRDALAVSRAPVLFSHSAARSLCNVTRNVPDAVLRLLAANGGLVMVNFYSAFLSCGPAASVQHAIAHINHIRDVAGVDCVGLGAGYDGINYTPRGLEDVSSYPLLFAELMAAGWRMDDLKKLAGLNLLRVLGAAERLAADLAAARLAPYEDAAPRPAAALACSSRDL